MDTVYDERHPYEGKEFAAVLSALSPRELRKVLKSVYRKGGKKVKDIVARKAAASGLKHGRSVGRSVRARTYPKGTGFMVTAKPHGKHGYHKNRFGLEKPVATWANAGTQSRYTRLGFQGRIKLGKGRNA